MMRLCFLYKCVNFDMELSEMRRVLCLLTVLMLCVSMVCSVSAAEGAFVPSITYKPDPEIVPVVDENGNEVIGAILDDSGEVVDYVDHGCLLVTPIAHVWDEDEEVPEEVEQLLTFVYEELNTQNMEIPYEKHGSDVDAANMVVRDLFDARWSCTEHHDMVEEEGVVFEITFDLGVMPDVPIYVMTYDEATKEWTPIVKSVNNGDGTVTCTFEHLCAIEFSMPMMAAAAPVDDAPSTNILPWIVILALAVVAVIGVLVVKNKKKTVV